MIREMGEMSIEMSRLPLPSPAFSPSFTTSLFLSLSPSLTLPSRPALPYLVPSCPALPRPRSVVTQQLKKSLCGGAIVSWRLIYGISGRRMRGALSGDTQEGHGCPPVAITSYILLLVFISSFSLLSSLCFSLFSSQLSSFLYFSFSWLSSRYPLPHLIVFLVFLSSGSLFS